MVNARLIACWIFIVVLLTGCGNYLMNSGCSSGD